MKALKNMSDEELMEEWTKQGEKVQAEKEKLYEFKTEHERRILNAAARQRLSGMSEGEREALAQLIESEGIESEEKVSDL